MQDLNGKINDVPLPKLLSWLKNNQHNGVLRLIHGQQRKEFRFRRGEPFLFRSNFSGEQLEVVLAKQGVAELAELQQLRNTCQDQKQSFVKELLDKQLLNRVELQLWMKQTIYLALDNASRWSVGTFAFRFLSEDQVGKPFVVPPESDVQAFTPPKAEDILAEEAIFSEIKQRIASGKIELPPMPDTMLKVRECLNDPNWDNQQLLKIIMADQLLTSSILKTANSSFYGFSRRVSSLQHATVLLGMKTIWGIITHQSLLGSFPKHRQKIQQVLDHSFLCAMLARRVSASCNGDEEDAFTCGLLHDIGKVVLYNQLADSGYSSGLNEKLVARFHCEAGLLIAAKWNLPELVLDAIENHHQPDQASEDRKMVEVIYVANCFANKREPVNEELTCLDLARIDAEQLAAEVDEFNENPDS